MALVPVSINLRPRKAAPARIRNRPGTERQTERKSQWVCPGCGALVHDVASHLESGDCPRADSDIARTLLRRARSRAEHQVVVPLAEAVSCDCCGEARGVCAAVVVVDACGHVLGKQCCDTFADEIRGNRECCLSSCTCPVLGCSAKLSVAELRTILPGSLIAALQERSLARFLFSRSADAHQSPGRAAAMPGSFVACPACEHTVELVLDGPSVGKASGDAAACFDTFRVRCRGCDTTFCAKCNASPYHVDLTCDGMLKRRQVAYTCRFCGDDVNALTAKDQLAHDAETPAPEDCCMSAGCRAMAANVCCGLIAECGHPCYAHPSDPCVRCMVAGCTAAKFKCSDHTSAEDLCGICFTDELRYAPCVVYPCGHAFHHGCVANRLRARWPGHRITFGYMGCPMCSADVRPGDDGISPALAELLEPHFEFRKRVEELVLMRAEREGLGADDSAADKADLVRIGMRQLAFYECSKCARPYFGGYQRCEAAMADGDGDADDREVADRNRHELVCGGCVEDSDRVRCPAHGTAFIEYKCKFCCSVATYFCWGRTHFCGACHRRQDRGEYLTRKAISDLPACPAESGGVCPLGTIHPPNGVAEYPLGCALCRERDQRPSLDASPDGDEAAQA